MNTEEYVVNTMLLDSASDSDCSPFSFSSKQKARNRRNNNKNQAKVGKNESKCTYISWKCSCITSLSIMMSLLIIFILLVRCIMAPRFAQRTLDNASMSIINGTIYEPTNMSIRLNASILISNAGFLNGHISSTMVTVFNQGIQIGKMKMPSIHTIANQNNVMFISSILTVTNKTQFQKSCKDLLQNNDQKWHLSADAVDLSVDLPFIGNVKFSVNIRKDLVLTGTELYNFIASDFNVLSATEHNITAISNLKFISKSILSFVLPSISMSVFYKDVHIGYVPINDTLSIKPGLTSILNQSIVITSNDRNLLNEFFSNYINGIDQKVHIQGPNGQDKVSVIDNILEADILALGLEGHDIAFGGLITSATQQGWKVDGKTIRGAYANFLNPLNVPLKIINMTATASLPKPIKYHVNLVKWVEEYDCEATVFADLSIGRGIYQSDHDKTWIDVDANGKVTYFNIASPPKSDSGKCAGLYDFSCCFATLTTAYACYLNPGIQESPSDGQLTMDYMPFALDVNLTMLIDDAFKVDTQYHQSFFPLYFGYEVYDGYAEDLELSCTRFTFE